MRKIALAVLLLANSSVSYAQIVPPPVGPNIAVTGNITAQGLVSSTNNTSPAGPTNSGVALSAAPDVADALFFDATQSANNRTYEVLAFQGGLNFRFKNDAGSLATTWLKASGGQASGITGITSNSGSGLWSHTGSMNVSGNFNATGTLGSSANNQVPSITNSGVTIGGGSNWANAQFYDQAATANNRTAALNWSANQFSVWFRSDAGTAITPLAISGGQGSGITGITSNSGSGVWAHTGPMTVSGTFQASGGEKLQTFLTASAPICSAGNTGLLIAVTDVGGTPAWNATLPAGTGSPASATTFPVFCDGTNWRIH